MLCLLLVLALRTAGRLALLQSINTSTVRTTRSRCVNHVQHRHLQAYLLYLPAGLRLLLLLSHPGDRDQDLCLPRALGDLDLERELDLYPVVTSMQMLSGNLLQVQCLPEHAANTMGPHSDQTMHLQPFLFGPYLVIGPSLSLLHACCS